MQASARLSSSFASKRVIAGVSSTIARSCYRTSRGKAHAAPLSAQEPPLKGPKRISKKERRVMIEEFVEKYRASNEGKFPSMKNIRLQLGGCHYTIRAILQELQYNQTKLQLDNAKAAPLRGTAESAEHSKPRNEFKAAQLQGTAKVSERSGPNGDNVKNPDICASVEIKENQDVVDVIISQKDATASSGIMEKTATSGSVGSSHHYVEVEAAKHDSGASDTCKSTDGSTLPDQTKSSGMKVLTNEPSVSLGVEAKSDSGNQQGERETSKVDLKNTEKILNACEVSDRGGSDVIEASMRNREQSHKQEPEISTNLGLLGSLKSFAFGIRDFWKKL